MKLQQRLIKYTKKTYVRSLVLPVVIGILLATSYFALSFYSSPANLRYPKTDHYHFRAQILIDGTPVDFSDDPYQVEYNKDVCSAELTDNPIHFHDNEDQMVHIHWAGITGGQFLKYYGWDFIGGNKTSLGQRYDQGFFTPKSVKTTGSLLPTPSENASYYIYTGDKNSFEQKNWDDFINMSHEEFFGQKSRLNVDNTLLTLINYLVPTAQAHGSEDDGHVDDSEIKDEVELSIINNLIGNVVIFVQENEPSQEQVKERFDMLIPLKESTCGG